MAQKHVLRSDSGSSSRETVRLSRRIKDARNVRKEKFKPCKRKGKISICNSCGIVNADVKRTVSTVK
jgi:protein-arginine kinase